MSADLGYLQRLKAAFPERPEVELELMCSANRNLAKLTGLSQHEHRKRGMQRLFPSRVWHEWREERVASVQTCLEKGIQELMWIGSSNSNKTSDAADIALTLWWTRPEMTSIYVTSPYETATETGIWAVIQEQFDEAKTANPGLPGRIKASENAIVLYDRNPRSFIRVATVDQIGKLVGKKARDFTQGWLILLCDELPEFRQGGAPLLGVMANLISVPNLLVIGAGNFADTNDALGRFCEPDPREFPNGYSDIDPDRHFRWRTARGGLCLRFDGLQSPNVRAGRDLYPFLTTISYIEKLAAQPGGLKSPEAMRFVRSAPITQLSEFTVTNMTRIRASGALDDFTWTGDEIVSGGFCDPGFGGDPCVLQFFKLGTIYAGQERLRVMALDGPPETIPIQLGLKDASGIDITIEQQIVDHCRKRCEEKRVAPRHFGFDPSLRSGITKEFLVGWSPQCVPVESQGPPTDRPVDAKRVTKWKERVDRLASELWFATALAIDSRQVRGLQFSPEAMRQLCDRQWYWSGKKKAIETKEEYKSGGRVSSGRPVIARRKSPGEADVLVGCVEMARRMGLSLQGVTGKGGGAAGLLLEMAREQQALDALYRNTAGLRSGELHGIKAPEQPSSNVLNRYH